MLFPPKAPMGLGQVDDPPILAPIRDMLFFWLLFVNIFTGLVVQNFDDIKNNYIFILFFSK
jgi:hypothetical protein